MHLFKAGSAIAAGLFLFSQLATFVSADCCDCPSSQACPDGTGCSSKYSCCGKGPCNIFCCNCDDGCRNASGGNSRIFRSVSEKPIAPLTQNTGECQDLLTRVDANRDGIITFLEWVEYDDAHYSEPWEKLALRWSQFDVEGKGYMTLEEAFHRKSGA